MPPYGQMFQKNQVLLIYIKEQPAFFARVEDIDADRKKGWWQMTFLVLTIPLKKMTWILDDDQIRGSDFTMGGNPVRIERVDSGTETEQTPGKSKILKKNQEVDDPGARIVSMFEDDE